jgi:aerobic-type carbon monoxide dehydrogenase small subunit (CoxS/CutS family)
MQDTISFHLNGNETVLKTDPSQTLLWVLRNHFNLTGTKYGCGSGFCGACTVIIDKEAIRSCSIPVSDVAGKNVITIEGLLKMVSFTRYSRPLWIMMHFSAVIAHPE